MAFMKPSNYDNTSADGDRKSLPAGGYVVQILSIEETTSSKGNPMLKMALDICEGDEAGFFQNKWKNKKLGADNPREVKYPPDGIAYVVTEDADGNCSTAFKGFCTALEDSGITVWSKADEFLINSIKNAHVGLLFRREENEYNGNTYWQTKPVYGGFRSVDKIRNGQFEIPKDKPLPATYGTGFTPSTSADSFSAAEDDIPFK